VAYAKERNNYHNSGLDYMNITFSVHPKVDLVQSKVFTKIYEAANFKILKSASLKIRFVSRVFGGVNCAGE